MEKPQDVPLAEDDTYRESEDEDYTGEQGMFYLGIFDILY